MKKNIWERVVLVLGIFLVVAAVFYTIVNYSASRQLSKEREKTEASGGHLDWRDLVPPPIPDDENAATIYQKVFSLMEKGNEEEEKAFMVVFKGDRVNWLEEDVQVIRSLVEKNKEALDLIWEATLREKCRFPLAYENGPAILLPHLTNMRRCARLLAAKALLQKEEGEVEEAVKTCQVGLRMGKSLQVEPLLITQFVRIAINSIVLHTLELILSQNEANPTIYSTLLKELDDLEGHEAFTRCLEGERTILGLWVFNKLREEPSEWRSIMGGLSGGIWMRLYITPLGRPLFKKDEVCWLRTWEKDIAFSKLPYYQVVAEVNDSEKRFRDIGSYCILTNMLLPALGGAFSQQAHSEAQIRACKLALALKIHKVKEGRYPDFLEELEPRILSNLPKDPFTGKGYIYKRKGKGFIVYSLGENMRDDGGLRRKAREKDYDIVWKCEG